jgi:hypothetical protein
MAALNGAVYLWDAAPGAAFPLINYISTLTYHLLTAKFGLFPIQWAPISYGAIDSSYNVYHSSLSFLWARALWTDGLYSADHLSLTKWVNAGNIMLLWFQGGGTLMAPLGGPLETNLALIYGAFGFFVANARFGFIEAALSA